MNHQSAMPGQLPQVQRSHDPDLRTNRFFCADVIVSTPLRPADLHLEGTTQRVGLNSIVWFLHLNKHLQLEGVKQRARAEEQGIAIRGPDCVHMPCRLERRRRRLRLARRRDCRQTLRHKCCVAVLKSEPPSTLTATAACLNPLHAVRSCSA